MSVIEADVQALRTLVQTQQSQLQSLQALKDAQPLVGLTTDSSWGMALEGLVLGLFVLALGAAALLGVRAPLGRRTLAQPPSPSPSSATPPVEFSDSMLYLADEDGTPESVPAVSTHLHDPQQDARASTLAHEDGDPELEYHRMALMAQGLSVTAGAGRVDSDRVPLEPTLASGAEGKSGHGVFSPALSQAEFDQQAAAEEVERVRRYLAQRRADRAKTAPLSDVAAPRAPAVEIRAGAPADGMPLAVDIPLEVAAPSGPVATLRPEALVVQTSLDAPLEPGHALEHLSLADGASLLVALEDAGHAHATQAAPPAPVPEGALLEWDTSLLADAQLPARAAMDDEADVPPLLGAPVQLALAQEFRDLGLWEEARARVLEILEQPDSGLHAQAQALLDELAPAAPAPSAQRQDSEDPWGH